MYFSKENTLALKGWAIIMMLYLHLFIGWGGGYKSLLVIGAVPVEEHFVKFSNMCVPIYVFISGYGLSLSEGKLSRQLKRISKLFIVYLPIFLIGSLAVIYGKGIPPVAEEFFLNGIAVSHSYNNHWWFIPMYAMLLLIFPILEKSVGHAKYIVPILLLLKIGGKFGLSEYETYTGYRIVGCCLNTIYTLSVYAVVFYAGILCVQHRRVSAIYQRFCRYVKSSNIFISLLILFAMIVISDTVPNYGLFSFVFTPVILPALLKVAGGKYMKILGNLSTHIWLSHGILLMFIRPFFNEMGYSILNYVSFVLYCILLSCVLKKLFSFSV